MTRIFLPILFLIASIGSFVFFTNPTYQEAKNNNASLARITDALKKANQLRDIRDKLAIERNNISDVDLNRITKMVPDSVENIGLIIELNNIARDKGMELLNPSIGGGGTTAAPTAGSGSGGVDIGPDNKKFGSLKMSFSVNTTYEKFIDFVQTLERSLRLVDVTSITFAAPDAKTGRSNFSVTIQTYWLK